MPINVYALVGPFVLAIIVAEFIYCMVKKNGYYSFQDSVIGLGTMILAQCVNLGIAMVILTGYGKIYDNYALFNFEPQWWHFVICYILGDFLFYWFHRAGHRINFFWAAHVGHHSAEELNYAVALRTTVFQRAASFVFYIPMAIVGFSPEVILTTVAINLVFQFLPHTRVIPKLPTYVDYWLNTPYHHRIHHAANQIYWDKNYGGTLIIWDRLFGTYEDETEVPYYGVTIHPKTWDPTYVNFHWYHVLWNDMLAADHFVDKIKIWFMPPGWRPRNLPPYEKDQPGRTAETQMKYKTEPYVGTNNYLIAQLFFIFPFLLLLVIPQKSPLTGWEKLYYSAWIWFEVTIWAALLERKKWAIVAENVRIVGMALSLAYTIEKYGFDQSWTYAVAGISVIFLAWLNFIKVQTTKTLRA